MHFFVPFCRTAANRVAGCALALGLASASRAQQPSGPEGEEHFFRSNDVEQSYPGYLPIGMGYNTITGSVKSYCADSAKLIRSGGPVGIAFSLRSITSLDEVRSSRDAGGEVSFGVGPWSGGASMHLLRQHALTSHYSYLSLTNTVTGQTEYLASIDLTPEARQRAAAGPEEFLKYCGNVVVAARTLGGQFDAVVVVETRTEAAKQVVDGKFKFGTPIGGGNGSIKNTLDQLKDYGSVSIIVMLQGGTLEVPTTDSLEAMARRFAKQFQSGDRSGSRAFQLPTQRVIVKSYDAAEGMPDAMRSNVITLRPAHQAMLALGARYDSVRLFRSNLELMAANRDEFASVSDSQLAAWREVGEGAEAEAMSVFQSCADVPPLCSKRAFSDLPKLPDRSGTSTADYKEIQVKGTTDMGIVGPHDRRLLEIAGWYSPFSTENSWYDGAGVRRKFQAPPCPFFGLVHEPLLTLNCRQFQSRYAANNIHEIRSEWNLIPDAPPFAVLVDMFDLATGQLLSTVPYGGSPLLLPVDVRVSLRVNDKDPGNNRQDPDPQNRLRARLRAPI